MKTKLILAITMLFFTSLEAQDTLHNKITELFNKEMAKKNVKNAFLQVYSDAKKINYQWAKGTFKNKDTVAFTTPFYTASIGKTFTATAIALLKDKNLLDFSDTINAYLPDSILQNLHVLNNVDYTQQITIAHLLQHTSGLPDYFEDQTTDGTPNIINQLFIKPNKIWTPKDCIAFTKQKMKPHFKPGNGYHYTDTEYLLLGLIVEQVSGLSLQGFYKEHIFKPLQMNHTYVNLKSEPMVKSLPMAEIFVGENEISSFKSLSADWAGGGIVATNSDLQTFLQALFSNRLLKPQTLKEMQNWVLETQGMYYGFGLRKIVLNELSNQLPKLELIGHSGSTGSFLYYCPSLNVYLSGTLNQLEETKAVLLLMANVLIEIKNDYN